MRTLFTGALLASSVALAQPLAVSVMDVQGLPEAAVKRVHRAALEQLGALAAHDVRDAYDWRGPKRACSQTELSCQREKVKATGAAGAVALWLNGGRGGVTATATFWLDGERVAALREGELDPDAPEPALKPLLEAVVPAWLKRGWGGLTLAGEAPGGSVLKVDGRPVPFKRGAVVAVTAGAHAVDLVLPDGRAVLQRLEVAEGARTRIDAALPPGPLTAAGGSATGLSGARWASYGAWMVGTATLLAAFIVGFVGRQTANGQRPCTPDSRECVTLAEAMERQRQAQGYAGTANVLLGTGLAFALAGAGLFTFDVLR